MKMKPMTTKIKYCVLLAAILTAVSQAQVLRITSFTRDAVTGNYSLTWTNQPTNVYCAFLGAHSVDDDDDSWIPAGNPLWNYRTTNTTTTLQGLHPEPPQLFFRILGSTNPLSCPSYPQFQVPVASITVDGSTSDWAGIQPALTDRGGDAYSGPAGSDITALYLARDSTKVYLRIDVTNGPPDSSVDFDISFYTNCFFNAGDRFVGINFWAPQCAVEQYTSSTSGGSHTTLATGTLVTQGNVIEASVPLSALNPPSPCYVRAYHEFDSTAYVRATFP